MKHSAKPIFLFSLTTRITLLVSIMLTLSVLLLGWQVERSINQHFIYQDLDEINVVVKSVKHALLTSAQENEKNTNIQQFLAQSVAGHHGIFFLVLDNNRQKIYQNDGPNFEHMVSGVSPVTIVNGKTLINWREKENSYRGVFLEYNMQENNKNHVQHYYIFVASLTTFHSNYLKRFSQNLWSILFLSLTIIIIAVWQIVSYSHRPLQNIGQQIQGINIEQLSTRLTADNLPVELTSLVKSLNLLLERIESSYVKLSNFSSDIAHELRTPVTNLMTQTQVSLTKARDIDAYRDVLYSNLEEYERMAKMISDMLLLAKADNGLLVTELSPLNIVNEIIALHEYFEIASTEQNITMSCTNNLKDSSKALILADKAMLRRALSNIYSNALRYSPNENVIVTTINQQEEQINISVTNCGEMIPETQLSHIFDRFYRGDSSRKRTTEGVGLGLAISKAIIKYHHGNISVTSSDDTTTFTVTLPYFQAKEQ